MRRGVAVKKRIVPGWSVLDQQLQLAFRALGIVDPGQMEEGIPLVDERTPRGPDHDAVEGRTNLLDSFAKGIGEVVLTPSAPAIANAIYDAIGIRFKDLPISREKVLEALKGCH